MLKVKNISYRYHNGPWLFENISLTIHPGEIVGLYGPSGLGKTTFAKVIAGYLEPNNGEVFIQGQQITRGKYQNLIQLVLQHPEKAINPRWRMNKVLQEAGIIDDHLIKAFGIKREWLRRWPSELSGGELQRFCLVRALSQETKYLIADEITTMLDAITQAQIWHVLLELSKSRDIGMLVISHDHYLLKRVCHQLIDFQQLIK